MVILTLVENTLIDWFQRCIFCFKGVVKLKAKTYMMLTRTMLTLNYLARKRFIKHSRKIGEKSAVASNKITNI